MNHGFEIYQNVLSHDECVALLDALNCFKVKRGRAGARHLMKHAAVSDLARDHRLISIARLWVGSNATPFRATLFEKSGKSNWLVAWHQDTALPLEKRFEKPGWGPWSVKEGVEYSHAPASALEKIVALRVSLDPSTEENGPLKVIVGSHTLGILDDDTILKLARKNEFVSCLSDRGGVIAMRPLIVHASSKAKANAPRRILHVEYTGQIEISPGIRLAIA